MRRISFYIACVALLIALCLAGYVVVHKNEVGVPPNVTDVEQERRTHAAPVYGISFTYSPAYYLKERHAGTGERPQLSVILVEDTTENRDVIEGRTTTPRDGPTAITIDVFPNPDRLTAEDWVRADTNWTVRTTDAAPIGRGSITGVTYSWSGLYEGKTVVVAEDMHAYVFSVTWLSPQDPILEEFDRILFDVVLVP